MNRIDRPATTHKGRVLAVLVAATALGDPSVAWANDFGNAPVGRYDVAVLSLGGDAIHAQPGESIPVDIVLTRHHSYEEIEYARFDLQISSSGLLYNSYQWDPGYFDTGSPFTDFSTQPTVPPTIEESLRFENLTAIGWDLFPEGTIVSLQLTVPPNTPEGTVYEVSYEHDTLFRSNLAGLSHDVVLQGPLTINVVPEPATVVLLGVGGLALWRRRKR